MFYNPGGGFQSVGYEPGGRRVLTLDNRARLVAWDVATGRPDKLHEFSPPEGRPWAVLRGCRSGDGRVGVLTAAGLHRFDLAARAELPPFRPAGTLPAEASEDGTLAVMNDRGYLRWRLWDPDTGEPLADHFELPGETPPRLKYNPVLSPDNRLFAMSVVTDGRLLVWDRGHPRPRLVARDRGRHFACLAFAPDASFLVAAQAARNGVVAVWDLPGGGLRWSARQEVFVWAMAVHPSGRLLAVATVGGPAGRAVRFLDAATGAEVTRFNWNAGKIRCLAFSPDGLTCAAGCSDRRLVVWDVDT
jgi:WD40 repeat protein